VTSLPVQRGGGGPSRPAAGDLPPGDRSGGESSPRGGALARVVLVIAGVAAALLLRVAVAGPALSASQPAGAGFAAALLAVGVAAGWRPAPPRWRGALLGVAGAAGLLAGPLLRGGLQARAPWSLLLWAWVPVVVAVGVAEEVALRGVLYSAVREAGGDVAAIGVAALAFGLLHVPLYGWGALPLDLAVGVWLGVLRMVSGGVLAPATAHVLADLATAWVT
jgi:membrane protease YdiL (CAAX protease family)